MKRSKISILVWLIVAFMMAITCIAYAYDFSDVDEADPLAKDISVLRTGGYIAGYPDGTFRPEGEITRAEFVRMVNGIFGYTGYNVSNLFSDVEEGAWYYDDVLAASQIGYIFGYPDGTFRPQDNVTKEEVCAILDRILSMDQIVTEEEMQSVGIADPVSSWANNSVRRVIAAGLMPLPEDGVFKGLSKINRGQVAYTSARVLDKLAEEVFRPTPSFSEPKSEYDIMLQRTIVSVSDIINDKVLPENKLKSGNIAAQKDFLRELQSNMQTYLNLEDKEDFDADRLFKETKANYSSLPKVDREELKRVVLANVDIIDLSKLRSFFGF